MRKFIVETFPPSVSRSSGLLTSQQAPTDSENGKSETINEE